MGTSRYSGNNSNVQGPGGLASKPDKSDEADEDVINLFDESEALELDEEVKDQLKKKRNDPHFGEEKSL